MAPGRRGGTIRKETQGGERSEWEKGWSHSEKDKGERKRKREKLFSEICISLFFFNEERKFDQSDCRIFRDLLIFWQISCFENSRSVIGQFWSRDRYPSIRLVEFASLIVNKENYWFTLFHQISLIIFYYSPHVTCILQSDWLNLILPI